MRAVFVKEFKTYLSTPAGYVFIALFLLGGGLIFAASCLLGASSGMEVVLDDLKYVLVFLTPMLTIRHFTGKPGVERILLSSPVPLVSITAGKFFAALAVLFVAEAVTLVYPLILAILGALQPWETFSGYAGLLLFGGTLISAGMMISSLSSSGTMAAASTLGTFLLALFAEAVIPLVSSPPLRSVLLKATPSYHLYSFEAGLPGVSSLVYFLSLWALFLFLVVRATQRKRWL